MEQKLQTLMDEKETVKQSADEQLKTIMANQVAEVERVTKAFDDEKSNLIQSHDDQLNSFQAELAEKHAQEIERVKADMMAMTNSTQSQQIDKLVASHKEDITRIRSEMEASAEEIRATHEIEVSGLKEKLSAVTSGYEKLQSDLASDRSLMDQQLQALREEKESTVRSLEEQLSAAELNKST